MQFRILIFVVMVTACMGSRKKETRNTPAPTQPPTPAKVMTAADSNRTTRQGVPAGYLGVADDGKNIKEATYRQSQTESRWIITTGPGHIMYSPSDTLSGAFTTASTFDQTEAQARSGGFGLFVGGTELDKPTARYTYFVVRGTGEFLIGVRDGAVSRDIVGWTADSALARQNAEGQARYRLAIQVRTDSVRFFVGGKPVAAIRAGSVPTNGFAGLRIDRNLKLRADMLRAG